MGELQNELREIKELLKEEKTKPKSKKFRLPWSAKVGANKAKKNWITIMKVYENGQVTFDREQIEDQTVMVDGIPRLAASGYTLRYKKNPLIIIPSWSVEPFSPQEHYKNSLLNGSNSAGYKLLLNAMKKAGVETKKKMGGWGMWIAGLALLAVIGYALFTGGGG